MKIILFWVNSGAEANENAFKERSYRSTAGRTSDLFWESFHGRTSLAVEAGNPKLWLSQVPTGHICLPSN